MFREINISKEPAEGEPKRRWYQSDYFDLYVFYFRYSERADQFADREFVGMQLCYDIRRKQRTLEWKKDSGFAHLAVKKGEGDTLTDHGASASLMHQGGEFDAERVLDRFMKESTTLPGLVRNFVLHKLAEYAMQTSALTQGPMSEPAISDPSISEPPLFDPFTLDLPDEKQ